ncbi:MAG: bifunctional 5,10-methylenetetrahydrofolate dehydrogenase/5,10-methenyltetrahydrofolate cyclohydrolase [Phycisphaerales bacterium]|nr:bifunctional 5,10-methylenetetrahydrofolate dehydrogenase/5,10-methenyltetrahydrofolate cyclohydrolase [Phycisphaerales bacterium]
MTSGCGIPTVYAGDDILVGMMEATATMIDGISLAAKFKAQIGALVAEVKAQGRPVRLDALLVGGADSPAAIYARNQAKTCLEVGIEYHLHELSGQATEDDILGRILLLNANEDVRAIMMHLPLPKGVDTERIQSMIAVDKDVEGVNPANIGKVVYGRRSLVPCTALAVMEMIESTGVELEGACAVCVGASNIVGKPVAVLLMRAQATVVSTNVHTKSLDALVRGADIVVSAAGVAGLVRGDMIKPGAVVIDVGINRVKGDDGQVHTVGDVVYDEVAQVAGYVSPVPGGVGPMTVAMMLRNTVEAAERLGR